MFVLHARADAFTELCLYCELCYDGIKFKISNALGSSEFAR